jgi:hypothetical protein
MACQLGHARATSLCLPESDPQPPAIWSEYKAINMKPVSWMLCKWTNLALAGVLLDVGHISKRTFTTNSTCSLTLLFARSLRLAAMLLFNSTRSKGYKCCSMNN